MTSSAACQVRQLMSVLPRAWLDQADNGGAHAARYHRVMTPPLHHFTRITVKAITSQATLALRSVGCQLAGCSQVVELAILHPGQERLDLGARIDERRPGRVP